MVPTNQRDGFTLIELLVTIVVAAILLGMAVPSFTSFLKDARLGSQAREVLSDLQLARSEAARLNKTVVVCPSNDGVSCTSAWTLSRIVFVDTDGNKNVDDGQVALKISDGLTTNQTMVGPEDGFIQFTSSGRPNTTATFKLCDGRAGNYGRLISIGTTGRMDLTIVGCTADGN